MRRNFTAITTLLAICGLTAAAALTACNGWPRAAEFSEAQNKPEKYPTYAATASEPAPFAFAGRHWVVSPPTVEMIGANLQSVGNAGAVTVYAEQGEQAPYAVLYTPAGGNKWRRLLPIN